MTNKHEIVARIVQRLGQELRTIEEARSMANEEALPTEDISESQRENRALENQFLVDGQTKLVREYKDAILAYETLVVRPFGNWEPAALTALVEVETGGERACYFLGPKGGGLEVTVDDASILVVTPQSPLGRKLLGRNIGDTIVVEEAPGGRTARITALT